MRTSIKINVFNRILLIIIFLAGCNSYSQEMSNQNSTSVNLLGNNIDWGPCPDIIPSGCNVAFIHGDPSKNNADAVFKFEPDTDIPEHWHNSAERMILVQGVLEVTYEGEDNQTLEAGYYAYGPSKKPHTAKCIGPEPCILYVAFEKPVDAFAGKP